MKAGIYEFDVVKEMNAVRHNSRGAGHAALVNQAVRIYLEDGENYLEVRLSHGELEVRCGDGMLSITPYTVNSIRVGLRS